MPSFWIQEVENELAMANKKLEQSSILLLGLSYKKDIGDIRESPALEIFELLKKAGAAVEYYDPFVPNFRCDGAEFFSRDDLTKALSEADCVMVATDHTAFEKIDFSLYNCAVVNCRGKNTYYFNKTNNLNIAE